MEQLLGSFTDYLCVIGYSKGTQTMIGSCVRDFLQWCGHHGEAMGAPGAIRTFYGWLHTRPLRRGTGALSAMMIGHYVYSLKVFFGWQQASGLLPVNPMSGLRFAGTRCERRAALSVSEVTALFDAVETMGERALLHVFYSCGLRRSEGVMLRVRDVACRERLLYVRLGKGARRRVVPLAGRVAAELRAYLAERHSSSDAFLVTAAGNAMDGAQCLALLKTLLAKAGLPNRITLHDLRRSIATHLLQGGMSAEQVRDFLGHQHIETTQLYARPAADQLLRV
ncbi:tyrosine-type recombinase/integrase [Chitinophaga sp. GCM10012297]|uniref:Tyrosine-type recombinase/integrase n=1 Tax=Chitinophaga chungangae TaxID=2821488 RepID=A0ABS3YHB2_9BACT|nr:tyrosine-type recombinase/integrase [Chitinophaga chungangae]MBO9154083.1 tyrosine-type recombinase/integrase [Chitinophaga chungangae]